MPVRPVIPMKFFIPSGMSGPDKPGFSRDKVDDKKANFKYQELTKHY